MDSERASDGVVSGLPQKPRSESWLATALYAPTVTWYVWCLISLSAW